MSSHLASLDWVESHPSSSERFNGFPQVASPSRQSPSLESTSGPRRHTVHQTDLSPTLFYGPKRPPLIIGPEEGGFEGLGGVLPGKDLTVEGVAKLVGPDRMVDIIGKFCASSICSSGLDVATQQSVQWTLSKWAEYVASRSQPPDPGSSSINKIYNVISLEISGTELAKSVRPPQLVRDIDWVDNFWRFGSGGKGSELAGRNGDLKPDPCVMPNGHPEKGKAKADWPKVQLYCLVSFAFVSLLLDAQSLRWECAGRGQIGTLTLARAPFTTQYIQARRSILFATESLNRC